jgi:hypothetical protein
MFQGNPSKTNLVVVVCVFRHHLIASVTPGKLQSLFQYLFTQNYRPSGSKTQKEEGTTVRIDKPSIPPGIGAGAEGLKKYVEECW